MKSYLVKHKDFATRLASRSGGVFTSLSDFVLANGVVYGVVLEDNRIARHIRVENAKDRDGLRGSKYIQSHLGETFLSIKSDLAQGKKVLFCGTPCQVNALNYFFGKKQIENLITVDIICHGVPSEKVWQDYLDDTARTIGKKIDSVMFRNKYKYGWEAHLETFTFEDGTTMDGAFFKDMFFSHEIIRPACFNCKFKNMDRVSDFTIGDAWGINEADPDFNDDNGVSIVLVNTKKAETIFENLTDLDVRACDMTGYMQECLKENYLVPKNRASFWKYYRKYGFAKMKKKYYLDQKKKEWIGKIKAKLK